ncbi:MAG: ribonuclease E/G [Alphaproteobacteria bacterium]
MSVDLILYEKQGSQTKIALLEEGSLREIEIIDEAKPTEGNIYSGKIVEKLTLANDRIGFLVNIGFEQLAFMNAKEEDGFTEGQAIVVQISQEGRQEKGAKVTTELQFVGSCLVYCPFKAGIQVSQKIANNKEVEAKKSLVEKEIKEGEGWILRTAIANADDEEVLAEMQYLRDSYKDTQEKIEKAKSPSLLKVKDNSLFEYVSKYQDSLEKIITNVRKLEETFEVEISKEPFKDYGIEDAISEALLPYAKLPSGGRVHFEETRACVCIDVDSSEDNGAGTISSLNIEAAIEIAKQVKLRNLSGKIVIDFAGQSEYRYLKPAIVALQKELRLDATRTFGLNLSQVGLVEFIRQRKRASLKDSLA